MPRRPICSGVELGQTQTIYVYVKPGNRSLYIRVDFIDWLLAYAADEQHFQGVLREDPKALPGTAVADYRVEWDFNTKAWEGTVQVGDATGQSTRCSVDVLNQDVWRKLADMSLVESFYSKSSLAGRKQAVKEYVQLWCVATVGGTRHDFETEWARPDESKSFETPLKRRRESTVYQATAVAGSIPVDGASAVAESDPQTSKAIEFAATNAD